MRKPNFIVILADDLGYGDLGCDGGTVIRTPNLDRMSEQGVRLTDFYASANVCTPSRAGPRRGAHEPNTDRLQDHRAVACELRN